MVTSLVTEPQLLDAGIPRKAWSCTLKQLSPLLRDRCRQYTGGFDRWRKEGMGLLFFGEDTEQRYAAYYGVLKAVLAQGKTVYSATVPQLTELYFHQRSRLQEIVETYDLVGITELNLPREMSNAGTVTTVVYVVTQRCNDCLPLVLASSLEMELPEDSLTTRYAGIGIVGRCTEVVATDEDPPESAWLRKHTRGGGK